MTAKEIDKLTRKLEHKVYQQTGIILTGVGLYSYNTGEDLAAKIQEEVRKLVTANAFVIQLHGFYLDIETKEMRFDVIFDFYTPLEEALISLQKQIKEAYPDYQITINVDLDVTD